MEKKRGFTVAQLKRMLKYLRGAKARIADPARWTTGVEARAQSSVPTQPDSEKAVQWCAWGAIVAEAGGWGRLQHVTRAPYRDAFAARRELGDTAHRMDDHFHSVVSFNDSFGRQHSEVIKLFEKTIRRLERQLKLKETYG